MNQRVYQCKVTLKGIRPPIWRRFQVLGNTTLADFHMVLQIVMGWTNSHLHEFDIGGESYGEPDPEFRDDMLDDSKTTLQRVARTEGAGFQYMYDFGDGWDHVILVEKVLPPGPKAHYPKCLAGKRACPPEDCGGAWGYMNLLATIADPQHEEHDTMMDWLGDEFDPEKFSVEEVNRRL